MRFQRTCDPVFRAVLLLIGAGLVLTAGCTESAKKPSKQAPEARKQLTIITPHNKKIRDAFEVEFSNWHDINRGGYVSIEWIVTGTPQCVEYVKNIFESDRAARPSSIPDIVFGGGIADHQALADAGYCVAVKDTDADIPAEVGGLPMRDAENRWYATGLSTFGIVYNQAACEQRGIAPPTTWTDLADPRFFGWIGLADPTVSGSNRESLNLILQAEGWQKGWATAIRILANSRALLDRSGDVLNSVKHGVFLASFVVNFDGLDMAETSDGKIKYLNPPKATAVSPDIISVLRCARDRQLAEDFLRFCLSEKGQVLWGVRSEHHSNYGQTLHHYPVLPSIYTTYAGKLGVDEDPLNTDFGLKLDLERAQQRTAILLPLVLAADGENHILLQRAWQAVIAAGLPADAVAELTSLPFSEEEAYKLGETFQQAAEEEAAKLRAEWSQMFGEKYRRVLEMVGG